MRRDTRAALTDREKPAENGPFRRQVFHGEFRSTARTWDPLIKVVDPSAALARMKQRRSAPRRASGSLGYASAVWFGLGGL
jgi:hypothetical protein